LLTAAIALPRNSTVVCRCTVRVAICCINDMVHAFSIVMQEFTYRSKTNLVLYKNATAQAVSNYMLCRLTLIILAGLATLI